MFKFLKGLVSLAIGLPVTLATSAIYLATRSVLSATNLCFAYVRKYSLYETEPRKVEALNTAIDYLDKGMGKMWKHFGLFWILGPLVEGYKGITHATSSFGEYQKYLAKDEPGVVNTSVLSSTEPDNIGKYDTPPDSPILADKEPQKEPSSSPTPQDSAFFARIFGSKSRDESRE